MASLPGRAMSYTLAKLLADVVQKRGPLSRDAEAATSVDKGGYDKVWDAFNRYVTETLDKRQTLHVPNFCTIGWKIEDHRGVTRLRPHFQLAENFARAYNVEAKGHPCLSEKQLAPTEEFNFSKAAIRFSQSLTKERLFLGLRALLEQMADAIAQGLPVSIEFEVGKLQAIDRDVRFAFDAQLYLCHGLPVPDGAAKAVDYQPSVSFAPPSKDALSLSLQGSRYQDGSVTAIALGGFSDQGGPIVTFGDAAASSREPAGIPESEPSIFPEDESTAVYEELFEMPSGTPSAMRAVSSPSVASSAKDRAHQAALERHILSIEKEAKEAAHDSERWEHHIQRCVDEDVKDAQWRREVAKDHAEQLLVQMQQTDERRWAGRAHVIEQASMHDFPNFRDVAPVEASFFDYTRERRKNLKEDLDHQINQNQRARQTARERERHLETSHVDSTKRELEEMKKQSMAKRDNERSNLTDSWARDAYLKNVRKGIQGPHDGRSSTRREGSEVASASRSHGDGPSASYAPFSSHSTPAPSVSGMSARRPYHGPQGAPGAPDSRPPTGSIRRMPIGAAASLALQRERLGSTPRR